MLRVRDALCLSIMGVLLALGMLFMVNDNEIIVFISILLTYIISVMLVKDKVGGYFNLTLLFMAFWGLYIFIGPLAAWEEGGMLARYYSGPYIISEYLIFSGIGIVGFTFPFIFSARYNQNAHNLDVISMISDDQNRQLQNLALGVAFVAFNMEMINFLRVGGLSAIQWGRVIYQTRVSDLFLTMPSQELTYIAYAIYAFTVGVSRKNGFNMKSTSKYKFMLLVFLTMPMIGTWLLFGRRGPLLTIILVLIVGFNRYAQKKTINKKILMYLAILYVLFAFITANRGIINHSIQQQDPNIFFNNFEVEQTIRRLVPTNNEFVVGLGNFDLFYKGNEPMRYGKTYMEALLSPVPRFLYPGEKPLAITYEFRDKYQPEFAYSGTIASTGFSFMYEAYLNFGLVGIFMVYCILGATLKYAERKIIVATSPIYHVFYLSMITRMMTFQRTGFFSIYSTSVYQFVYILAFFTFGKILGTPKYRKERYKTRV